MSRAFGTTVAALAALTAAPSADAAPILSGAEGELLALAAGYQRQQDVFAARESGLSLDAIVKPEHVPTLKAFFAQSAVTDFEAFSGKHPFEVLQEYVEHADVGNFGGVATVGVAARLMHARSGGASTVELVAAREAAVRAARAWHAYGAIGGAGVVARGVRRTRPLEAGAPPLPGTLPALVPLKDAAGAPLPEKKGGSWRAPVAPGFDDWIWMDDTSKDQVIGWALACTWLHDALAGDPDVPKGVVADLAADLVAFTRALMKVAPERGIDLCIRDADGRLTGASDLNPRQIVPGAVLPESTPLRNGFNAVMAMAIVRAAYHLSGEPEIGRYYYEELVGRRDFPTIGTTTTRLIFTGPSTNYSNVNMLAMSLALLARIETDPYVRQRLAITLEEHFWSVGDDRDASHVEQGWFDVVYGAYAAKPPAAIRGRVVNNLGGFKPAPAFERDRVNCDAAELAAKKCVGIDGATELELADKPGHGGGTKAKQIVPMSLRPDTDFAWRSDPHDVNGSASTMMDPGGDYLAAYWMARVTDLDDTTKNLSPLARPPLPYTLVPFGSDEQGAGGGGGSGAGGVTAAGGGAPLAPRGDDGADGAGCAACRAAPFAARVPVSPTLAALLLLGAVRAGARRR